METIQNNKVNQVFGIFRFPTRNLTKIYTSVTSVKVKFMRVFTNRQCCVYLFEIFILFHHKYLFSSYLISPICGDGWSAL